MYLGQPTAFQIRDYSIFLAIFLFSLLNISEYLFSTSWENCQIFAVFVLEISSTE